MEIWLKGSKRFRFPVIPSSYQVTDEHENNTININSLGEIDLGGKRNLKQVSFSSFFPKNDESYVNHFSMSPKECVKRIESIKNSNGGVCKFIATGVPINIKCRIISFTWGEQDGTGDIYFSITIQEHRDVTIGESRVIASE